MKKHLLSSLVLIISLMFVCSCEEDPSKPDVNIDIAIEYSSFTDERDGKIYSTLIIGNQEWMAENLNYETSSGSWIYNNISNNASTYGRLYDWRTAHNVCPSGWHLPSDDEWKQLEMVIGISEIDADKIGMRGTDQGSKLKSTSGWNSNGNGTNEYGFNALPGGIYTTWGGFDGEGDKAYFWSSTAYSSSSSTAWFRILYSDYEGVRRVPDLKDSGLSVRCVRD